MRKIIHIDMDAFYASVEQRDRQELRGKPVAVGYSEKRGVVCAASYEARVFGIRSAMSSAVARKKCPELIFVPPRFDVYRSISDEIRRIFHRYTAKVEPVALDEAYLDVTESLSEEATAWKTARKIRAEIFASTGLTASAGVSFNKFLAKLASGHKKPNGQFAILASDAEAFLAGMSVSAFHGIGPATAKKMNELGIQTGADLKSQSREFLLEHFGKLGGWFHGIARGDDPRPVEHARIRKSVSSETTFTTDLDQFAEIEPHVLAMADDVWKWCEQARMFGRTVTLKIRFADFKRITRSRSERELIVDHEKIRNISVALLRSIFPLRQAIRLVGIGISNFEQQASRKSHQLDLRFDE